MRNLVLRTYRFLRTDQFFLDKHPRVLFYHGVADSIVSPAIESESILAGDFERQLKYIVKHFVPISIDEFYCRYINNSWEGKEILLTFDDGYRNMLTTGLPLLEKYNIPFALFVTTDNISNNQLFPTTINRIVNIGSKHGKLQPDNINIANETSRKLKTLPVDEVDKICKGLLLKIDENELEILRERYSSINPMNWDETRIIAESPLCTVGSHCVTHICCHERQSIDEIRRQFAESRKEIQDRLNVSCDYCSYPNGNYTPEVMKIAEECGYKMAFSTKYEPVTGDNSNLMAVGRIYVPYDYSRFVYSISRYPRR